MISIIIPTRNEEKVIAETLENLRRYSGPMEIIVSDGGSDDATVTIAKNLADRVVVHDKKTRQTIGGGRNAGAACAKGNYLVFLDADVSISNPDDFFDKAIVQFEKDTHMRALAVSTRVLACYERRIDRIILTLFNMMNSIMNNVLSLPGAPGEFQMVDASAFHALGGYDERFAAGEDYEFLRRMGALGKVRFDRSLVVHHTGRRIRAVGWPKLLWTWFKNDMSVRFFKRSSSTEWEVVR